ncbi:tetratricopeptide repeat protein [Pectobacterium carotovorum]|uniref:tetratricopeptide repeat protein n=1 Tax=Pectobacterium TaxID=122277 RepID=UPI0015DDD70B|nr:MULTISPECIES: hypothetical protein [Pectobacterium]MBA0186163.1 hypothetical protein [Pectobacterium versatile]MBN3098046.1 hypothetical protein [Pectobacterium brasiliense]MBN3163899.1 hypothetical protein [Pectobacterium brasiliense]
MNTASELKYYYISNNADYVGVRKKEQNDAFLKLAKSGYVFIEAGIGAGLYGFVYSLTLRYKKEIKYFRLNFSDVIVKSQIDDCFSAYTGVNPQLLAFEMGKDIEPSYLVIIDNVRGDIDQEALNYLIQFSETSRSLNSNVYFVFSSSVIFPQFQNLTVKLNSLSLDETTLILRGKFSETKLDNRSITELYNLSEGVVIKLEQIIKNLGYSSPNEILCEDDLFAEIYTSDDIPDGVIRQIDFISENPDKLLTFTMLKILAILKNGESLSNLRKDKLGEKLSLKNTREIIQLGLASVIEIDSVTTLIKLNPIIKDYVLSLLSQEEIFLISSAYLKVVISETKKGIHLGATNRKIIDNGYNTEEDNASSLLKNSIIECKSKISHELTTDNDREYFSRKLTKLMYLSLAYVYSLDNSCRYKETVSAATSLLQVTSDIENPNDYKFYYHLGDCQRMLSLYDEAAKNLQKARSLCPVNEKNTLERIYVSELYLLEETDMDAAIALAKKNKRSFKANTSAHINSEYIISAELPNWQRVGKLESLEKKCRRLEYHSLANNILFTLNTLKKDAERLGRLNRVLSTDNNNYNYCKAMIFKYEILVGNDDFDKISPSEINELYNIFNYMFKQGFNSLLNRCHDLLWTIANHKRINELIVIIYFKSTISWALNENSERLEKYDALFQDIALIDNDAETISYPPTIF